LHSRLLAELLNPRGSHQMADSLLIEFIAILQARKKDIFNNLSSFDTKTANVEIEYPLGPVDLESIQGGRIDILIRDQHGLHIIIENKIYASDLKDQLARYNNIKKKAALIYLTPDGRSPQKTSAGSLAKDKDFVCLSYAVDILQWLQNCLDKFPEITDSLRWSLMPYIWTLQTITQQSKYDNMSNDVIANMLESDDTIASSFEIVQQFNQFKEKRGDEIFTALVNAITEKKLDCVVNRDYSIAFPYMEIFPSGWKNHLIALTEDQGLFLGIKRRNADKPAIMAKQIEKYSDGYKDYPWWLCSKQFNRSPFRLRLAEAWLRANEPQIVRELLSTIEHFLSIAAKEPNLLW